MFYVKKGEIINIDLTASLIKALLYINFLSTNLISLNIYHLNLKFFNTNKILTLSTEKIKSFI